MVSALGFLGGLSKIVQQQGATFVFVSVSHGNYGFK